MNRCSKCNNELVEGARFCNICGTPIIVAEATTPPASTGLKRTISPETRRVHPSREGRPAHNRDEDVPDTTILTQQKQNISRPSIPPIIPKTTIEFISAKAGQAGEKQKSALPDGTPATTISSQEVADAATSSLADSSTSASANAAPLPGETANPVPEKTGMLPLDVAAIKTTSLPTSGVEPGRTPGIIRPIGTSSSPHQNTPVALGQTPSNPMSPLPVLPNTPALPAEKAPQTSNARRPMNTAMPNSLAQDNQRQIEGPKQGTVLPQPVQPANQNRQQAPFYGGAPQTPLPSLHDMPTNYLELQNRNSNGANTTASRQELPLFSPESFAYTSKAAEHWRSSWRDLQNVEAGPAEDVSKGQASVAAPLAARKDSFIRMRAIRSKQNSDAGERNFGFWVTLFLMISLIGGLATYIVYSYLPNASFGAASIKQPAGPQQPSIGLGGTSSQIFTSGQSLQVHGDHFGANDPIQFSLDGTTPILATNGNALSTQSNSQGAFDITIVVGKDWAIGTHIISASDARANLSADMSIQVNADSTPVTGGNSTDLAFTLNGQHLDHLSFTAQVGRPAPPAQRIAFTNISGATMQWSATASTTFNLNWLSIVDSDYAGQLDISQPHTMGISINPAGLSVTPKGKSPYSGQIVFTINGNKQLTMPVLLTIIDATPEMIFSPNPLVVTANANGTCQPGNTLTFINLGTSVISWSANPDNQNNIKFVNDKGAVTEKGQLQPSGMDGDTTVVTLNCFGVKTGDKYVVNVFANRAQYTEIIQIE